MAKDLKTVKFLATKTGIAREVPVLFQWVHDGLVELHGIHGGVGAVCRSSLGREWSDDAGISCCWRQILKENKPPKYTLKKSQKLFISHAIKQDLPHVVANWTGHLLTVQERHYCEGKSYLPSREEDEYAEIGDLSEWGANVRKHLSAFSNSLPQGR